MNPLDSSNPPPLPPGRNSATDLQWITFLHLSGLAGIFLVGFGQILCPLVIWLLKKNEVPGLDAAGKTVLNFQISWSIWFGLSGIIAMLGSCLLVPLALPFVTFLAWLAILIQGAIKASNGQDFRPALTIRFFR